MGTNTCIIHRSYLTKQIVEDYKTKMELRSVEKFSPGLTENILKSLKVIANFNAF